MGADIPLLPVGVALEKGPGRTEVVIIETAVLQDFPVGENNVVRLHPLVDEEFRPARDFLAEIQNQFFLRSHNEFCGKPLVGFHREALHGNEPSCGGRDLLHPGQVPGAALRVL